MKSEFSFANSAVKSSASFKSGQCSYESDKKHEREHLSKSFNTSQNLLDALDSETRKLVNESVLKQIEELDVIDELSRPVSPTGNKKHKRKHKKNKSNKHHNSFAVSELAEENKTATG